MFRRSLGRCRPLATSRRPCQLALLAVSLLIARALAAAEPITAATANPAVVAKRFCIPIGTIKDYKAIDALHLLLRTKPTGWQYQLELDRRCTSLPTSLAIGWKSFDSRLCSDRGDLVLLRREHCRIVSIRPYVAPRVPDPAAVDADTEPPGDGGER